MGSEIGGQDLMQSRRYAAPHPATTATIRIPGRLHQEADAIGYPVLIRRSRRRRKGMRRVERATISSPPWLPGAGPPPAFGDDHRVLVEKYTARARHIEIQVFGDRHGIASISSSGLFGAAPPPEGLEEAPAPA